MSYTFLQELGEVSSAESFSDIPQSVLLRLNLTAEKSCSNGSETESCQGFQSGTMLEPLMENHGGERSISSAEAFLAKTSALPEKEQGLTENEADSGEKWREWFAKWDRVTCSWKIRQLWLFGDWDESLATWPKWGMMHDGECFPAGMWEHDTSVRGCGLSLPTIGKNEYKGTSKKRFLGSSHFHGAKMSEGLRTCESDLAYTHPDFAEEVMGWPITWTALAPLGMDKFQAWRHLHGEF